MKIRVVGHGGESHFDFDNSGPWSQFRDELVSRGHEISTEPFGANCDALIANKHSIAALKEAQECGIPANRRALILWEPSIVEKERYQPEILENYGIVFAPSVKWAQKVGAKSFKWPQDKVQEIEQFEEWSTRQNKAVIIQGNKFSARKGELYSLRRKIIKRLENDIDLFGTDWNRGFGYDWLRWCISAFNSNIKEVSVGSLRGIGRKRGNYFGSVTNKYQTLNKYKIAIVIENSADFVSEKLFDSLSAGCLVIYVGVNLHEFGIEIPDLIQTSPKAVDIQKKFIEVKKMPQYKQYELAKSQNEKLRETSGEWENTLVLRKLASDILGLFS
jgi:hypothetical protein